MRADSELSLLHLAEAVGDRAPVSWGDQRAAAGELAATVGGLERLHALAAAFAAAAPLDERGGQQVLLGRWGHLELISRLGEGSFGEVYRARDPNLDREVALKLRRSGPGPPGDSGRRLLEEARRLARIRHPNVVAVHGADLCDGRVGVWTELVEGQTLEERLAVDGPLGAGEAVAIGLDLCRALAAIHAAGLVHGDVKAANVLRERGGRIVLTDLGSATEAGLRPLTGSPATLAPEVHEGGPATPAADLYSLGVLLRRLLTGEAAASAGRSVAVDGRGRDLRVAIRDLRPDLPDALVRVLERAAEPDPEGRYPSAGAFEQALARTAEPPGVARPGGRRPWAILISAAATALLVLAAFVVWQTSRPPEEASLTASEPVDAAAAGLHPPQPGEGAVTPAEAAPAVGVAMPEGVPAAEARAPAPRALEVAATMLLAGDGRPVELADGDRVDPGDLLALEREAGEPVHVWVLNEDLEGAVFLLFPIAGLDLANPLPGERRHRLPGRLGGEAQHWQVTSAGGRERFLMVASRHPLPELERELAGLRAASSESGRLSRGVGGLGPSPRAAAGRLGELADRLAAERRASGSVWLRTLELAN
ncbi:MAG TPA: protein kinase, partial [Thermoanaerobaculia bacterium]|nr:protein kinase [Thermoanaerobaculia bacterium]